MNNSNQTFEVDVLFLSKKLWNRKFLILLISIICASVAFLGSSLLLQKQYTSTTRIYVVNQNKESTNLTTQELQAGTYLVNDYKEIITSVDVMTRVVENNNLTYTPQELRSNLKVSIPTDTRVISISVEVPDNVEAAELANAIREVAADKIKEVTKVEDVTTLEAAIPATSPSSPNVKRNTFLGFVVGMFLTIAFLLLTEVVDDRVKRPEDIEEVLGMTLLGVVPHTDNL